MTTDKHNAPSVAQNHGGSGDNATAVARYDLSTSEGGRGYISHFFATKLRRHDFTDYIATRLAADFACALAQHLAATGKQQVGEVMRSDLSGYAVAASQVRRGYDVECDRCGKFCDTGPGPCQQVGEVQGDSPDPSVIVPTLRAMVRNYSDGHRWDHLDARMCRAAADRIESLEGSLAAPPAQGIDLAARPMDTAPRDGTLVRLLVDFDENAIEDSISATWTIGACNDDNVSEGARIGWQFAGWCWTHDHFTEGTGTPVGWLPLIDGQRDAAQGVES